MRVSGYRTGSLDIKYSIEGNRAHTSNPMDILSPSGFTLALACILKSQPGKFLSCFAIKCASWTAINSGTSNRSPCASIGFDEYSSVSTSNAMLERTLYLMVVVVCLGGTFVLEQPRNSNMEFYPAFVEFLRLCYLCQNGSSVFRVGWWMSHYDARTPKRHFAYSNSPFIRSLDRGILQGWKKRKGKGPATAVTYESKSGKKCYKGTKHLKQTEEYTVKFGRCVVDLHDQLTTTPHGQPPLPGVLPTAQASFEALPVDGLDLGYCKLGEATETELQAAGLRVTQSPAEPSETTLEASSFAEAHQKDDETTSRPVATPSRSQAPDAADLGTDEGFIATLEIVVKKKSSMTLIIDEQWLSEKEMKDDFGWSAKNSYDGCLEYYVVVKERGQREEQTSQEEIQRKLSQATEAPKLEDNCFAGINQMEARAKAEAASGEPGASTKGASQELETRDKLKRFLESVLQKAGKIRSLVRELKDKYASCDSTSTNLTILHSGMRHLDEQYDKCHAVWAYGEANAWGLECSKACASEMKIRNAKKYEKKDIKEAESTKGEKPNKRKLDKESVQGRLFGHLLVTWVKEWENPVYGYSFARDKWSNMYVVYIADEAYSPAMLEAALIEKYQSHIMQGRNQSGQEHWDINVMSLKSWLEFIVQHGAWHVLVGLNRSHAEREQKILLCFWERLRALRPSHEIFALADASKVDLSRTVPLMLHGDEGRGRKKAGFLCISFYSYIGFGTREANAVRKGRPYHQLRLNYGGHSYLHRMLTSVLPKMMRDHLALKDILRFIADDACNMLREGVKDSQGNTFRACVLQCCGDWQWQIKAGQLNRSYQNVPKQPTKADGNPPKGICHMCCAGQRNVHWEGYGGPNRTPSWLPTLFSQSPFDGEPSLNQIPYIAGQQPAFYTFDVFHSFHLGVAKSLAAGCLAMASDYMWATSVDSRLEQLSCIFVTWCNENREHAYLNAITRPVLGWMDKATYPNGYWSKGHTSTTLIKFFIAWAEQQDLTQDGLMQLSLDSCRKIDKAMRIMYQSDIFLTRSVAKEVTELGLGFLEGYKLMATQAYRASRALFPHMPKGHALEHIFYQLRMDLDIPTAQYFVNPLNHSVQVSEDFVGRTSRLARRTHPLQVVTRVLERFQQAAYRQWHDQGWIQ
ncbi:unnamed protein product [Durusdinium trenchii]|uniref:Uncharacterized protein n=1 Tax=Durusdinium trenchii TaxID=1381693 RepID=A0ABP0SZI3_9DINO